MRAKASRRVSGVKHFAEQNLDAGRIHSARSGTNEKGLPSGKPDGKTTRKMNITTAVTRWRWPRAGSISNRTSGPVLLRSWPGNSRVKISFQAAAAGAAAFSQGGSGRNDSTNYPHLWKSRGDFSEKSAGFWKMFRPFLEKMPLVWIIYKLFTGNT